MNVNVDLKNIKLGVQPHVLASIVNLSDGSDMSFAQLDRLVKSDQNMAALILKAANSSLYSRGNEIRTLQHAISMLGFQIVRSLAMAAASKTLFQAGNYTRFKKFVWEHSIVTAMIARELAQKLDMKDHQEEAFIAGLLHDIGKVIMNVLDRKKYIQVIDMATTQNIAFADAETKLFGYNHLDLGGMAVTEWKLPGIYKTILSYHDGIHLRPELQNGGEQDDEDLSILYLVSYANYLALKNGFGLYLEDIEKDGEILEKQLKITPEIKKYFTEGYKKHIEEDDFFKFFMTMV